MNAPMDEDRLRALVRLWLDTPGIGRIMVDVGDLQDLVEEVRRCHDPSDAIEREELRRDAAVAAIAELAAVYGLYEWDGDAIDVVGQARVMEAARLMYARQAAADLETVRDAYDTPLPEDSRTELARRIDMIVTWARALKVVARRFGMSDDWHGNPSAIVARVEVMQDAGRDLLRELTAARAERDHARGLARELFERLLQGTGVARG